MRCAKAFPEARRLHDRYPVPSRPFGFTPIPIRAMFACHVCPHWDMPGATNDGVKIVPRSIVERVRHGQSLAS
jgi:hypothetical protein